MRLRRLIENLRAQNWTAVVLDFLIVVIGVFIGIQFANLNEARLQRIQEVELLKVVKQDLERDIIELRRHEATFNQILSFGTTGLAHVEGNESCDAECWEVIVALFHASQWIDVVFYRQTYDELTRMGLPSDLSLKQSLASYYYIGEQFGIALADFPKYREIIRSLLPPYIQSYLWESCYKFSGQLQQLRDCAPPISQQEAKSIIKRVSDHPEIAPSLTYWMSTVSLIFRVMPTQRTAAQASMNEINRVISESD